MPAPEPRRDPSVTEPNEPDVASKQVVIRISSRLHNKLQLAVKDRRANNPGQTITQSDVIRTILEKSL